MKVQFLNSSSIKTKNLIKKTFTELMNEKKDLNKITVTELTKKANITRSTFYTHYSNIYDVVNEYQSETIELFASDDKHLNTLDDIYNYFDEIFDYLSLNDKVYKIFLASDDTIYFLEKLKKLVEEKIFSVLKIIIKNDKFLELHINFLMDGITDELIKYFKGQSNYSLEDIHITSKKLFKRIFPK